MTSGMRYKYPDIVVILDSLDFPAPQSGLGTSLAQLVPIPGSPYPAAVIEDELIGVIYATRVSSLVTDGGTSVLLGTTSLYQYSSQWWYSCHLLVPLQWYPW